MKNLLRALGLLCVVGAIGCGADPGADGDASALEADGSTAGGDGSVVTEPQPPGSACGCDADCAAVDGHDGICVVGVCMTRATSACSAAGSTAECAAGSRCWGLQGFDGGICWPDCETYGDSCAGTCDGDGSCTPSQATSTCEYSCSSVCPCDGPEDCGGDMCVSGQCIPATSGEGPGAGPGPDCPSLPQRDCTGGTGFCSQLVTMDPRVTPHYDDYPINGETTEVQYRSYLRRDLAMLLDYATARTLCKAGDWETGIGGALGLGDMSEKSGAIPGTAIGQEGHPTGTHTGGNDVDLAYYQIGQPNNYLRPVCPHTNAAGQDQYHCTGAPHILDVWRTAMFLGSVFESPRVRIIGVDGQVGPQVQAAIAQLCQDGWLSTFACQNVKLAYEETNMGYGWYNFHHHHAHISVSKNAYGAPVEEPVMECRVPGCEGMPLKPHPYWSRMMTTP